MEKERKVAIRILDEFEELLGRKGIKIPSEDREGREEEANLYGTEYYYLEDATTKIVIEEKIDEGLHKIVELWRRQQGYEDGEAMDGDAVDKLVDVIRDKINLHQGNITRKEYFEKHSE